MNRLPTLAALALFILLALPASSSAGTVVLDALTDLFPPSPCLPHSGQPVIYVGSFCDGATCPPDLLADPSCSGQTAIQFGLPGVLTPARRAEITGGPTANARSAAGPPRIDVQTETPAFVAMELSYLASNLDLVAMEALSIHVLLTGNISPAAPLWCLATLGDNDVPNGDGYAQLEIAATQPGDLVLPLSAFAKHVAFDFSGLEFITLAFHDCNVASCTGSYPGRQYAIGPIRIETGVPTTVSTRSWGQLKTRYR